MSELHILFQIFSYYNYYIQFSQFSQFSQLSQLSLFSLFSVRYFAQFEQFWRSKPSASTLFRKVEIFIPSGPGRNWDRQGCDGAAHLLGVVSLGGKTRGQITWEWLFSFKQCHRTGSLWPFTPSRHQSYLNKRLKPFYNIEVSDILGRAACSQLNNATNWVFMEGAKLLPTSLGELGLPGGHIIHSYYSMQ